MVNPHLLVRPDTDFTAYHGLDFSESLSFETHGEPIFVTDPTYLADVFNSVSEFASFLRQNGVIVKDFGGDTSGPVWWQTPFVKLCITMNWLDTEGRDGPPLGVTVLADEVGCDSGSFVFLPMTEMVPTILRVRIADVLDRRNGALLNLPSGKWTVWYEQLSFDRLDERFYRNIVLRWEPDETLQPRLPL